MTYQSTTSAQTPTFAQFMDDLSYHEDYWLGYKHACSHDWELRHMFTSSYERCKKCGEERDSYYEPTVRDKFYD